MKTIFKLACILLPIHFSASCDKLPRKPVLAGGYESAKVSITITHVPSHSGGGGDIDTDQGVSERELGGQGSSSGKIEGHYNKGCCEVGAIAEISTAPMVEHGPGATCDSPLSVLCLQPLWRKSWRRGMEAGQVGEMCSGRHRTGSITGCRIGAGRAKQREIPPVSV